MTDQEAIYRARIVAYAARLEAQKDTGARIAPGQIGLVVHALRLYAARPTREEIIDAMTGVPMLNRTDMAYIPKANAVMHLYEELRREPAQEWVRTRLAELGMQED